ncbi:MAG: sugar ABC transporter substrate-binding protein [Phycisphaeraceae bacterium]|nr:sugar ABC transporter substrate-binding protein [Phycisphaerales bacterium]QOJ16472.1 MAG: sugar ABC transporter substrate-binding protein [Phycisphaeraceae bacterium]
MRSSHLTILLIAAVTLIVATPRRVVPLASRELTMAVWGMPFEDLLFRDRYARGFEELHPGWRVRYQRFVSAGLIPKYQSWHFARRGADVLRLPITNYHAMVELGLIEPLDRFINDPEVGLSSEERADFFPHVYSLLDVDGSVHALPSDNAQMGLFYHRDVFDAYNAAHPNEPISYPDSSWTWDDLRRVARLMTERSGDGRVVRHGVVFDLWAWPYLAFLRQAGGAIWDETGTTCLIDSPEGVEAMELVKELASSTAPIRSLETAEPAVGPVQLFMQGRAAILLDGCWRVPSIDKEMPGLNYAVAPLPRHRQRAVVSGAVLWAINAHSEHKEQAWAMIKWMTSREGSLLYWDALRVAPPARVSVLTDPAFRATSGLTDDDGRVWVPPLKPEDFDRKAAWLLATITPEGSGPGSSGDIPGFVPVGPYQQELESQIARAMVQVVRGEKAPTDAVRDAARSVHDTIDRDRRAKGLAAITR